eukprot:27350_1
MALEKLLFTWPSQTELLPPGRQSAKWRSLYDTIYWISAPLYEVLSKDPECANAALAAATAVPFAVCKICQTAKNLRCATNGPLHLLNKHSDLLNLPEPMQKMMSKWIRYVVDNIDDPATMSNIQTEAQAIYDEAGLNAAAIEGITESKLLHGGNIKDEESTGLKLTIARLIVSANAADRQCMNPFIGDLITTTSQLTYKYGMVIDGSSLQPSIYEMKNLVTSESA